MASMFPHLCMFLLLFLLVDAGLEGYDIIFPGRVKKLSAQPRIYSYSGFLSNEECEHLKSLAHGELRRSMIVANNTGMTIPSKLRTSLGMFLQPEQDEIVRRIERRIAAWTFLPVENGERMQILQYTKGKRFNTHGDYFTLPMNLKQGNRVATVIMYLSDVESGGETFFPNAVLGAKQEKDDSWSPCAYDHLAVKPMKGDALLFFNMHANGTIDYQSLHGSCPVLEGVKWTATRWIHAVPYDNSISQTESKQAVYDS